MKKSEVVIRIHSGRNRIVRRIFEHFGYEVKKLDRIMFAGLDKKGLGRGRWRFLSDREIGFLNMISDKKDSAEQSPVSENDTEE
jgi:23S rRNA pseudouridine2605 synthase